MDAKCTSVHQLWPSWPPSGDQHVFKLCPQQRSLLGPDAPDQHVSKLRPSDTVAGACIDQHVSKLRPGDIVTGASRDQQVHKLRPGGMLPSGPVLTSWSTRWIQEVCRVLFMQEQPV